MAHRIGMPLSVSGVRQAQRELRRYRDDLQKKCEVFIERLAEKGIAVASQNVGGYGKYIIFSTHTTPQRHGYSGVMMATQTGIITSEWRTADGSIKSADVSPLLMIEFGSGLAGMEHPRAHIFGMGTGTFPGQTHAEDPEGWWYMDVAGEWHHSYGIAPELPVYKAAMEMRRELVATAREVFGA